MLLYIRILLKNYQMFKMLILKMIHQKIYENQLVFSLTDENTRKTAPQGSSSMFYGMVETRTLF